MGISSVFKSLYFISFFGGLLASETCRINGYYEICEEECCTGSSNYCCESNELSIGAIFGIVVGCMAGIIILCCVFICCVKNLGNNKVATVPNTTRALPTYQPPGAYAPQPFHVGSQGFPVQQYPGQGQPYPGHGQQYPGQGQQYPGQGQPNPRQGYQYPGQQYPGQAQPVAFTNSTQADPRMSELPPPYSEMVEPSAPAYGFTPDAQPLPPQNAQTCSGNTNQGFNYSGPATSSTGYNYGSEGIPERTNLKPSAP